MVKFIFAFLLLAMQCPLLLFSQGDMQIFEPSNFTKLEIAHRGGYAFGPENAIPTIMQNIRNLDLEAIEVDLRLTKDGHLVLFHDENVGRLLQTNDDRLVSEMSLQEITSIPYRDESFGQIYVPSFKTFMDSMLVLIHSEHKKFLVELDFKPTGDRVSEAVSTMLTQLETAEKIIGEDVYAYFYASTFYPDAIKEFRKQSEKLVTAYAVNNSPDKQKLLAKISILFSPLLVRKYKASGIEPSMCMINERYVRRWQKRGVFINAWTANRSCEKEYLSQFEVAVTTNCPLDDCDPDPTDQVNLDKGWCKSCKGSRRAPQEDPIERELL